jgi:hypothetical protein
VAGSSHWPCQQFSNVPLRLQGVPICGDSRPCGRMEHAGSKKSVALEDQFDALWIMGSQ